MSHPQKINPPFEDPIAESLQMASIGEWEADMETGQILRTQRHDQVFGYDTLQSSWDKEKTLRHIVPSDRPLFEKAFLQALKTGHLSCEYRILWPDKSLHWILMRGRLHANVLGKPGRMSGIVLDISEIKRNEEHLNESLRLRDEFLSIASHELKTPLTSLKFQLQLLERQAKKGSQEVLSSPQMLSRLENCDKQIKKLSSLIDNLLDVSQIRNKKMQLHFENFDLCELVHEVSSRFVDEIASRGGELRLVLGKAPIVCWDRNRIQQAVINLISNAMKYGQNKLIEIIVEGADPNALFIVRDHGIGLSQENQQQIFESQSSFPAKHFGGLELGLYVVQQVIKAHGGSLHVESQVGNGTAFYVRIPLYPIAAY